VFWLRTVTSIALDLQKRECKHDVEQLVGVEIKDIYSQAIENYKNQQELAMHTNKRHIVL
jgi:orotate phosphoribosyltransferase-like protein